MILRYLGFAPLLFGFNIAKAQDSLAAPAAAVAPTVQPGAAVRPGMLWGTIITRDEFQPLTNQQRWGLYWRQTYWTPGAFFGNAGPALGSHLRNEPPQWGQGMEGYAKRFGDQFARSAIRDTVSAAGSAALGYEVRYVKCQCKGTLPRIGHALLWNFITLNRSGKTVLNVPKFAGSFAGEFAGNTWRPAGYNSAGDAMRNGAIRLAYGSAFNIIREFVPKKKK